VKSLIPLSLRVKGRIFYNRHWAARHYDSPLFGAIWSLFNRRYQTEGMAFNLPHAMMPIGFRSRFFFDAYEDGERKLAKKHIHPDDTILELGACIGVVSSVCNRILNKRSKHVVVEANPQLIPWLEGNRSLNKAEFAIESGMLSKSSDGTFRIEKFIVSGSANTSTGTIITVPVFDIESVTTKHGFIPSTIVMDIEGGEVDFLAENETWLNEHREVRLMIIEMHPFIVGPDSIREVTTTLERLGFACAEKSGPVEAWLRV
jgi:FkbM family methyltransferase